MTASRPLNQMAGGSFMILMLCLMSACSTAWGQLHVSAPLFIRLPSPLSVANLQAGVASTKSLMLTVLVVAITSEIKPAAVSVQLASQPAPLSRARSRATALWDAQHPSWDKSAGTRGLLLLSTPGGSEQTTSMTPSPLLFSLRASHHIFALISEEHDAFMRDWNSSQSSSLRVHCRVQDLEGRARMSSFEWQRSEDTQTTLHLTEVDGAAIADALHDLLTGDNSINIPTKPSASSPNGKGKGLSELATVLKRKIQARSGAAAAGGKPAPPSSSERQGDEKGEMLIEADAAMKVAAQQRVAALVAGAGTNGIQLQADQQHGAVLMNVQDELLRLAKRHSLFDTSLLELGHTAQAQAQAGAEAEAEAEAEASTGTIYEVVIHPACNAIGYVTPRVAHLLLKEIITTTLFDLLQDQMLKVTTAPALAKLDPEHYGNDPDAAWNDVSQDPKRGAIEGKLKDLAATMPKLEVPGLPPAVDVKAMQGVGEVPSSLLETASAHNVPDVDIETPATPIMRLSLQLVGALRDGIEASVLKNVMDSLAPLTRAAIVRKVSQTVIPVLTGKVLKRVLHDAVARLEITLPHAIHHHVVRKLMPKLTRSLSLSIFSAISRDPHDDLYCALCAQHPPPTSTTTTTTPSTSTTVTGNKDGSGSQPHMYCSLCAKALHRERYSHTVVNYYAGQYSRFYGDWYASYGDSHAVGGMRQTMGASEEQLADILQQAAHVRMDRGK